MSRAATPRRRTRFRPADPSPEVPASAPGFGTRLRPDAGSVGPDRAEAGARLRHLCHRAGPGSRKTSGVGATVIARCRPPRPQRGAVTGRRGRHRSPPERAPSVRGPARTHSDARLHGKGPNERDGPESIAGRRSRWSNGRGSEAGDGGHLTANHAGGRTTPGLRVELAGGLGPRKPNH